MEELLRSNEVPQRILPLCLAPSQVCVRLCIHGDVLFDRSSIIIFYKSLYKQVIILYTIHFIGSITEP